MPGWPVTHHMLDNYGAKPTAFLPTLNVSGVKNPVVQIVDRSERRDRLHAAQRGPELAPARIRAGGIFRQGQRAGDRA